MEEQARESRPTGLQPTDPSALRISDADRHQVSEVLRRAAGEGRLDLDELDERLEAAYRAKTYADLVPITADLPVHAGERPAVPRAARERRTAPAGPSYDSSVAVLSETKRVGPWQLGASHGALALMGSVTLDLRAAHFAEREVTLTANAVMGEVKIVVDAATVVVVEGFGVMGEFKEQRPRVDHAPHPDSPVLRVRGVALMGSVTVRRRGSVPGARSPRELPKR